MTVLLFCDETTIKRSEGGDFFLYGGLILPPSEFAGVCDLLDEVRSSIGLKPSEPLKFSPKACPSRIERADWTAAKSRVLEGLGDLGVELLAIHVHEAIADPTQKVHWALVGLCVAFDQRLQRLSSQGFVVVDHTREIPRADLAQLASGGVEISGFRSGLLAVGGISVSYVESSLPLQAVDVVIGGLRYCLEHPSHDVSADICRQLERLDGHLEQRPRRVKVPAYQDDYDRLWGDWQALSERSVERPAA